MARRDIPGNFDIEIRWDSDIFPEVYSAEETVLEAEKSIGIIFCFI